MLLPYQLRQAMCSRALAAAGAILQQQQQCTSVDAFSMRVHPQQPSHINQEQYMQPLALEAIGASSESRQQLPTVQQLQQCSLQQLMYKDLYEAARSQQLDQTRSRHVQQTLDATALLLNMQTQWLGNSTGKQEQGSKALVANTLQSIGCPLARVTTYNGITSTPQQSLTIVGPSACPNDACIECNRGTY